MKSPLLQGEGLGELLKYSYESRKKYVGVADATPRMGCWL